MNNKINNNLIFEGKLENYDFDNMHKIHLIGKVKIVPNNTNRKYYETIDYKDHYQKLSFDITKHHAGIYPEYILVHITNISCDRICDVNIFGYDDINLIYENVASELFMSRNATMNQPVFYAYKVLHDGNIESCDIKEPIVKIKNNNVIESWIHKQWRDDYYDTLKKDEDFITSYGDDYNFTLAWNITKDDDFEWIIHFNINKTDNLILKIIDIKCETNVKINDKKDIFEKIAQEHWIDTVKNAYDSGDEERNNCILMNFLHKIRPIFIKL